VRVNVSIDDEWIAKQPQTPAAESSPETLWPDP